MLQLSRGQLELRNVTFGYDAGPAGSAKRTCECLPGTTVALVGATGAGPQKHSRELLPRFSTRGRARYESTGKDVA